MKKNGIALAIILIILVMTLVACSKNDLDTCVHNVVIDEAVSATCTEKGLTEGKHCSKCGEVLLAQTEVPALGHTYLDDGSCSICGYQEYIFSLNEDGESYTITSLGEDFEGTELVIPAEYNGKPVTTIGKEAFSSCTSLTSIVIPDSVTTIGYAAFSGCSSLESLTIPFVGEKAGVTGSSIYQYPLGYLFGTSSYTGGVATKQRYYGSSTSSTTITTYYIPSSLKSVTVTGGYIPRGAFYNCNNITNITLGDDVTTIGESAFDCCDSLTSVTIGDSVTSIGSHAFYYCRSLSSIVIPDSVTTISEYAFRDCISLTSVTIGENSKLTTIDYQAFDSCDSLTSIVIPDSVTSLGGAAFYDCTGLKDVYYTGDIAGWCGISFKDSYSNPMYYADNLYIDGKLVEGGLKIPDSVTTIGYAAFVNCDSLTSVTFEEGSQLTTIGSYAFAYCNSLTSIVIPPDSVTEIGSDAFRDCISLTSVTIGDSVTTIGSSAFWGCDSLTSVTIGDSVTTIGQDAFKFCTSLTSIVIPDSVTYIGDDAFYGTSLTDVYYTGTEEEWNAIEINNTDGGIDALYNATRHYNYVADEN